MNLVNVICNLRDLRKELDEEQKGMTFEQTALLIDVCQAIGLGAAETNYVLGIKYTGLIDQPIWITSEGFLALGWPYNPAGDGKPIPKKSLT
jgi:hypothetical protein